MTADRVATPIRILLGLALFVWFLTSINFSEAVKHLSSLALWSVLAWFLLNLSAKLLVNEANLICLKFLDSRQDRAPLLLLGFIRSMGNYVGPMVGTAIYVAGLKERLLVPLEKVAPFMAMQSLVLLSMVSLLGLVGVVAYSEIDRPELIVPLLFLSTLSLFAWLATHFGLMNRSSIRKNEWLRQVLKGFSLSRSRWILIFMIHVIHLIAPLARGVRLIILVLAMGGTISLAEALVLIVVSEASMLIHITPGNIGIREGAILLAGSLVGLDPSLSAAIALGDRSLAILFAGLLGLLSVLVLGRKGS